MTIFSPRCTNTLWISNFHCNCICIFNSMISIRYYCSSNSIFLLNLKITFIVMYGQYSVHILQIHFEFQIFIDIVSISFISMKIYQILLRLQLNLFSSIGKLHLLWCMYNIQSTFTNTLWISNFHCNCVYMIHLIEDLSDISPASTQTT